MPPSHPSVPKIKNRKPKFKNPPSAAWFQNRDKLGLKTIWPYHGSYQQFTNLDLLPEVRAILNTYRRWSL
jgi:hypothetical protein